MGLMATVPPATLGAVNQAIAASQTSMILILQRWTCAVHVAAGASRRPLQLLPMNLRRPLQLLPMDIWRPLQLLPMDIWRPLQLLPGMILRPRQVKDGTWQIQVEIATPNASLWGWLAPRTGCGPIMEMWIRPTI
jgi:hypothetical protein